MGGRIWVQSTLGKGSTFGFTILATLLAPPPQSPSLKELRTLNPLSIEGADVGQELLNPPIPVLSNQPCQLPASDCAVLYRCGVLLVSQNFSGSMSTYASLLSAYGSQAAVVPTLRDALDAMASAARQGHPTQVLILIEGEHQQHHGFNDGTAPAHGTLSPAFVASALSRAPALRVLWITNRRYAPSRGTGPPTPKGLELPAPTSLHTTQSQHHATVDAISSLSNSPLLGRSRELSPHIDMRTLTAQQLVQQQLLSKAHSPAIPTRALESAVTMLSSSSSSAPNSSHASKVGVCGRQCAPIHQWTGMRRWYACSAAATATARK